MGASFGGALNDCAIGSVVDPADGTVYADFDFHSDTDFGFGTGSVVPLVGPLDSARVRLTK